MSHTGLNDQIHVYKILSDTAKNITTAAGLSLFGLSFTTNAVKEEEKDLPSRVDVRRIGKNFSNPIMTVQLIKGRQEVRIDESYDDKEILFIALREMGYTEKKGIWRKNLFSRSVVNEDSISRKEYFSLKE